MAKTFDRIARGCVIGAMFGGVTGLCVTMYVNKSIDRSFPFYNINTLNDLYSVAFNAMGDYAESLTVEICIFNFFVILGALAGGMTGLANSLIDNEENHTPKLRSH